MRDQLQKYLQARLDQCVQSRNPDVCDKMKKKLQLMEKRNVEIVKVTGKGNIMENYDDNEITYLLHLNYVIKDHDLFYIEEEIERRRASFHKNILVKDEEIWEVEGGPLEWELEKDQENERVPFIYNRLKAVQYAERWWNDYNPAYKKFDVDCTNYISQCLHAGGAPMRGYPNRNKGWWMRSNNWSFSWSVAHAFRWYLGTSTVGLRAKEVSTPEQLQLGDVICYDFQGDGRFDHTTIVTGKDANGMPLVNAHTSNSRLRYWNYEDSTAYTPNIQYKFFTIVDDPS
ncbi:hypothetical protein J2S13_002768 [Oikeobacillus pervagus]|uniref:Putative amidase domain-containing protein n=1 Tax=Oikeobacillus pervagus TaxID=1325931 RepID=A0AAJ1T343_9BACI|nr:amidase domain-containing protein [Oikeobacillus pervagus]MDQ0216327.1 hypothetical protein [Oikeobacillus pervagus]